MPYHNNYPLDQVLSSVEIDSIRLPEVESQFDGTYYQIGGEAELLSRFQTLESKVTNGVSTEITLGEYQRWVELNWLTPHYSLQSGDRLTRKLLEEAATEYTNEIAPLPARSQDKDSVADTTASIDEMGDVLWSLVANASNLGIDLETTISRKFNLTGPLTVEGVQQIVEANPYWVPLWTDTDIEEVGTVFADTDELDPFFMMALTAQQIRALTMTAFDFGKITSPVMAPELLQAAADFHADALMIYCYYIAQWSRSNLATVVSGNFTKITERVATNQLDKSSGNR